MIDREVEAVFAPRFELPTCMGCGQKTTGSVGASGLQWRRLCQPCKNAADQAALVSFRAMGLVVPRG